MNETMDLIRRHRSIRHYTSDPIPEAHIHAAVEAGQAASTSSAVQSYCVIRVRDEDTRTKISELTGPQEKVARCPGFFVVCGDTRRHRLICAARDVPYETRLEAFMLAIIDATLFAQNMVLAFESMGYGICYIGGLRNRLPEVDRLLELPAGIYPIFGLCVGVPADEPMHRPRLPIESVLFDERYPDDERVLQHVADYDATYRAFLRQRAAATVDWSARMAEKFSEPQRADLAAYYQGKGAALT